MAKSKVMAKSEYAMRKWCKEKEFPFDLCEWTKHTSSHEAGITHQIVIHNPTGWTIEVFPENMAGHKGSYFIRTEEDI